LKRVAPKLSGWNGSLADVYLCHMHREVPWHDC
jgi:hypothetical protein